MIVPCCRIFLSLGFILVIVCFLVFSFSLIFCFFGIPGKLACFTLFLLLSSNRFFLKLFLGSVSVAFSLLLLTIDSSLLKLLLALFLEALAFLHFKFFTLCGLFLLLGLGRLPLKLFEARVLLIGLVLGKLVINAFFIEATLMADAPHVVVV